MFQRTLKDEVRLTGKGLHTGEDCGVRLCPSVGGSGVVFYREDKDKTIPIPASWRFVQNTANTIALGREGISVRTVEHLLSALAICGIDNCAVFVTGPEVPLLDGAAAEFLSAIDAAGSAELAEARGCIHLRRPVWVDQGERYLLALPADELSITFSIYFPHKAVRYQACHLRIDEAVYRRELAKARTFGFQEEIASLRANGLALGGDYASVLVYGKNGPIETKVKYDNECVRHKVLDLIGDLSLLGAPLTAHIIGHRSGHSLSIELVKKIAALDAGSGTDAAADDLALREFCERVYL